MPEKPSVSSIKFVHLLIAFLLAVFLPTLWSAVEWNAYQFHLYELQKSTFDQYIGLLFKRFYLLYGVCFLFALMFGVPAFYGLRRIIPFKWWSVAAVAFVIATLPNVFLELANSAKGSRGFGFWQGDCKIISGGVRTACGWKHFWLDNIFFVGIKGVLAGIIFYMLLTSRRFLRMSLLKKSPKS